MGEARRQHYAKAMGLALWYARARLPGALPSPVGDFSGFAQAQVPRPSMSAVGGAGRGPANPANSQSGSVIQAAQLIQAVAAPRKAGPDRPSAAAALSRDSTAKAEGDTVEPSLSLPELVPEFRVRAYRYGRYVFVNLAHPETDANREVALLANLASVLCQGHEVERLFDWEWPVFSNHRLPGQGAPTAAKILLEQVKESAADACSVVLLGCPPVWAGIAEGVPVSFGELTGDGGAAKAPKLLITFSLGELLLEPQRKRDVWQHLRRLSECA